MSSRTVDLGTAAPSSAAGTEAHSHPNPVCTEIGVSVQGSAHTAAGGQASQPFLEQTTTVIVFAQGGVVRLSESVTPGQILILRHLRTNDEAACRVVSVKSNPNVKGYVELEFLQPSPGFWGMDLPAAGGARTPSAAPAQSLAVPAAPARAEHAASDPSRTQSIPRLSASLGAPPPAVRSSVPAVDTSNTASSAGLTFLPDLLDTLTLPAEPKQRIAEPAPRVENARPVAPPAPTPKPPVAPRASAPDAARTSASKGAPIASDGRYVSDLLDTLTPIGETILRDKPKSASSPTQPAHVAPSAPAFSRPAPVAPLVAKPTPVSHAETSLAETALPAVAVEPAAPAASRASALLSTPSVSEEVAPFSSGSDVVARGRLLGGVDVAAGESSKGLPKPMRILAIAAAVALVLAAGAGVYRWQKKSAGNAPLTQTASEPAPGVPAGATDAVAPDAPPAGNAAPAAAAVVAASSPADAAKNSHASSQPNTSVASTPAKTPAAASAPPAARGAAVAGMKISAPTVASHSAASATPTIASAVPNSVQNASAAGLLGESPSSGPAAPTPTRTSSGVTQPRLLNAPAPIYPYAARAEHIQGDVSVDLVIDETGKVASMTVVSGPALLRPAALDALRQRKYVPAMLDGKPTTAHIVVIVHFQI
jgi:TonB family protein